MVNGCQGTGGQRGGLTWRCTRMVVVGSDVVLVLTTAMVTIVRMLMEAGSTVLLAAAVEQW